MKSRHGDKFNHDDEAHEYDAHVLKEEIPYRAGYEQLLSWVAGQVNARGCRRVLDLGTGTGNLAARIDAEEIVGVDNSGRMLAIAREKLNGRSCALVQADLLAYFDSPPKPFDAIVSTYALHHLMPDEKAVLFRTCHECLNPGGIMVFGDLMFPTIADQQRINAQFRAEGLDEMVDEAEEEYYWIHDRDFPIFHVMGYELERKQFSTLAWAVLVIPDKSRQEAVSPRTP